MAISVHPGTFNTELISGLSWGQRTFVAVTNGFKYGDEKDMASNTCWGATSKREGIENGGFYTPVGVRGKKVRENENMELAGRLWEFCEKELAAFT